MLRLGALFFNHPKFIRPAVVSDNDARLSHAPPRLPGSSLCISASIAGNPGEGAGPSPDLSDYRLHEKVLMSTASRERRSSYARCKCGTFRNAREFAAATKWSRRTGTAELMRTTWLSLAGSPLLGRMIASNAAVFTNRIRHGHLVATPESGRHRSKGGFRTRR